MWLNEAAPMERTHYAGERRGFISWKGTCYYGERTGKQFIIKWTSILLYGWAKHPKLWLWTGREVVEQIIWKNSTGGKAQGNIVELLLPVHRAVRLLLIMERHQDLLKYQSLSGVPSVTKAVVWAWNWRIIGNGSLSAQQIMMQSEDRCQLQSLSNDRIAPRGFEGTKQGSGSFKKGFLCL